MEFFNRLLNRPPPKPAICDRPPTRPESASEASQPALSRDYPYSSEPANPAEGAAAASSSSGPSSLAQESLSSASSFQSLASSLSSKSSSGICADSAPGSPDKNFDHSYVNVDIPDLDELISACANINLNKDPQPTQQAASRDSPDSSGSADLSQDQTFASAADETISEENQLAQVEQSLQTFKTCTALEATQVQLVEPSPIVEAKPPQAPQADDKSSVIPYVSFEESVLRKHQTDEDGGVELKCSLASPARQRDACSPTPCVEIDVVEAAKADHVNAVAPPASHDQPEQVNLVVDGSTNSTYEETPALNSTVVLNSELGVEEPSLTSTNVLENLNSTVSKLAVTPVSSPLLNKSLVFAQTPVSSPLQNKSLVAAQTPVSSPLPNKSLVAAETAQEGVVVTDIVSDIASIPIEGSLTTAQEAKSANENLVVASEFDNLNKTQDIVSEVNALNVTQNISQAINNLNVTQDIVQEKNNLNTTQIIVQEKNIVNVTQDIVQERSENASQILSEENSLNKTAVLQEPNKSFSLIEDNNQEKNSSNKSVIVQNREEIFSEKKDVEKEQEFKVPFEEPIEPKNVVIVNNQVLTPEKLAPVNQSEAFILEDQHHLHPAVASTPLPAKVPKQDSRTPKSKSALFSPKSPTPQSAKFCVNSPIKSEPIEHQLDDTVAVNKSVERSSFTASELVTKNSFDGAHLAHENLLNNIQPPPEHEYESFKPQQQSTELPVPACDFDALQEAALSVAKVIDASLEKDEDSEQFVSATTELFEDPSALDYLTRAGSKSSGRSERYDSLYMKFDPLAQRQSMLPQKNLPCASATEEEDEKQTHVDAPISNMNTPRKNPAIAAIDRLLFYSPSPPTVADSVTEVAVKQEKKEIQAEVDKSEPPAVPIVDEKMTKELELVRSTVLQLEAELEKQKRDHKEQLDKLKVNYEDKLNHVQMKFSQLQSQLTQEVTCKDQMTVVVEEYEKSISRLIAEREKDRTTFEAERAKLQEELQVANQHLSNTEAAFSDVHTKYERLKNVVSAYKSNETVLKESIAENQETIKTLENRYEQLKSHAMAQLEKANLELTGIRKHNEAENIKLKALVRKAELKSKSLEETVEQKINENKELTKIIDEMIARVD